MSFNHDDLWSALNRLADLSGKSSSWGQLQTQCLHACDEIAGLRDELGDAKRSSEQSECVKGWLEKIPDASRKPRYFGYAADGSLAVMPSRHHAMYVFASEADAMAKSLTGCRDEIGSLRAQLAEAQRIEAEQLEARDIAVTALRAQLADLAASGGLPEAQELHPEVVRLRAKLAALRNEAAGLWGERDRWDADPVKFLQWLHGELVIEAASGMKAEAQLAEANEIVDILRQYVEDRDCGYDALASADWDLLRQKLEPREDTAEPETRTEDEHDGD